MIYEHLSSGGLAGRDLPERWLREGWAMFHAVTTDLAAIEGVELTAMLDARLHDRPLPAQRVSPIHDVDKERRWLCERSADFDGVLLIAPECDGILYDRCRWVEQAGGRLLGPSSSAVRLAGDKYALNRHLAKVFYHPVPHSWLIDDDGSLPTDAAFPAVLKPRFGAGSQAIVLVRHEWEWEAAWQRHRSGADGLSETPHAVNRYAAPFPGSETPGEFQGFPPCTSVLEEFIEGTPASVSVLAKAGTCQPLLVGQQLLSDDGTMQYLGGRLSRDRFSPFAWSAATAVDMVPGMRGYVGVDLVIAPTEDSPQRPGRVTIIEINPRLTTSYVGLRRLAKGNLAEWMLRAVRGEEWQLAWRDRSLEFDPDGSVRWLD